MAQSKDVNRSSAITDEDRRFSVAPMLDWTDQHCRYFLRLISKRALLYTEMVTTGALIYGKGDYLAYNREEHPVALQLGGCDPTDMARCAEMAQERGYDEVNINVGCPSDRVKNGSFGACLMAQPDVVSACVQAMQNAVDIPVTVKCRIGIDDMDEDADFSHFVETVAEAGCETFIVHARKAWLQGLSPKENREIPPLNYPRVHRLKAANDKLHVSINGGIKTLDEVKAQLEFVDGVMVGREAYGNPYMLSRVDSEIYGDTSTQLSRSEIVHLMNDYVNRQTDERFRPWHAVRHMLGLFQGQAGGKIWRRYLSQHGTGRGPQPDLLLRALDEVEKAQAAVQKFNDSKNSEIA